MTIERTRELLKEKVAHLSDSELLEFINKTDKALDAIMQVAAKKLSEKKDKVAQQ